MAEREMDNPLHILAGTVVSLLEGERRLPPRKFRDKVLEMRGQNEKLVLEKKLCATDMNRGWLSIPKGQMKEEFLTWEEIRALENKEYITVSLIEPCLEVRPGLQLKKWNKGGTFSYVLTKEWNSVAHPFERNGLRENCLVQLWSFRVGGESGDLCFCLVKVDPPPAAVEFRANHE